MKPKHQSSEDEKAYNRGRYKVEMPSQNEKNEAFERAKQKVNQSFTGMFTPKESHKYKTWYVMLQEEDLDGLTNDEIDELVYKYRGKKNLWEQGTKEEGFDGKYKTK